MMTQELQLMNSLIPDLLPQDFKPMNVKRFLFLRGQGVVIYNKSIAVEVYTPRAKDEEMMFFSVYEHHGKVNQLTSIYPNKEILSYDDYRVTKEFKRLFDEAAFQYGPFTFGDQLSAFRISDAGHSTKMSQPMRQAA